MVFPVKQGYQFDDPHCHHARLRNFGCRQRHVDDFQRWLFSLFQARVSRCAVTDWGEDTPKHAMKFIDLLEISDDYNSLPLKTVTDLSDPLDRQYTLEPLGNRLLRVTKHDAFNMHPYEDEMTMLLYRAQEVMTSGFHHISAIGSPSAMHSNRLTAKETVDEIVAMGGEIAIVEHPCTKEVPGLQYWYTTLDEDGETVDLVQYLRDSGIGFGFEVFNGYNLFHMKLSNATACRLADRISEERAIFVPRVAASDNHYSRDNYGTTGLWFPEQDLSAVESEDEFFRGYRDNLMHGGTVMETTYTSKGEFIKTMVINKIKGKGKDLTEEDFLHEEF